MDDWLSKAPITTREPTVHKRRWVPGVEIYSEEEYPDGWLQKFVVHDGTNEADFRWCDPPP